MSACAPKANRNGRFCAVSLPLVKFLRSDDWVIRKRRMAQHNRLFHDGILRADSKRNKQFKFDGKFPIPKNIDELERNSTRTSQPNIQPLLFRNPRTESQSNLVQRIGALSVDCSILIGNIYPRCRPPRRRRQRNNCQQFDLQRFLMQHFGREVSYSRFSFLIL